MAKRRQIIAGGTSSGKPGAKPVAKPVVKPSAKPKPNAVSFSSSLVFDPTGQFSDILSDEQKARRDLYLLTAGRDLEQEAEKDVALERAGLLKPGVTPADRKKLGKGGSREFASAMDALDAIDRSGDAVGKALGKAVPALALGGVLGAKGLIEGVEKIPTGLVRDEGERSTVGKDIGDAARGVVGGVGEAGRFVIQDAQPAPTTKGAPKRPSGGRPTFGTGGLKQTRPLQDITFETVGKMPFLYGSAAPESTTDYFSVEKAQDVAKDMAAKPNKYIDASAADKTIMVGASPVLAATSQLSIDGLSPPELQSVLDQNNYGALSPNESLFYKEKARNAGHDVSNWDSLTPGEKLYKAYNSSDFKIVAFRNAVRAVGATGSAPAGIKAIGDAAFMAFRGDTAEGKNVINGILEPYEYASDVAERDGLAAGLAVAFRDNPVDFALAANVALRTTGRVAGVTTRTGLVGKVGGRLPGVVGRAARGSQRFAETNRPIVAVRSNQRNRVREQVPLTAGDFRFTPGRGTIVEQYSAWRTRDQKLRQENAADIAEAESVGRVDDAGVPFRYDRNPLESLVVVGYTGPNLLSPASLAVKAAVAKRWDRYGDRLQRKQADLFTRTQANISDGVFVEVEKALSESLGRAVTDAERQRAAFELTWAKESFSGKPVTPKTIASYFRDRVREVRESNEFKADSEDVDLNAQIARWEAQVDEWERIDAVELDPKVVALLREVAKPLGQKNDLLIAAALGRPTDEVKRQNYLRMLIIDPDFEVAAKARKAEKNAGKTSPKALIKSQQRIVVLAGKMREKVSERGFGSKSKPKSRARFAALRDELVVELRRAERAALVLGDEALADEYRAFRQELTLSRVGASERSAEIADRVARVGRLEADVTDLPVAARGAYEAAQEARRVEDAAEAASVAATTAARAAAQEAGVGVVNKTAIDAARVRLDNARKNYEVDKDSTSLTPDQIEASRRAVVDAEARLVALREAEVAQAAGVEARGVLREAIGKRESAARKAQRIIEKNDPVLDTDQVRAALDVSGNVASVRIRKKKDYEYYTLDRARGEVLDEFIARVEGADANALLHLVQKGDIRFANDPAIIQASRALETGPSGRIRKGRLKSSQGALFALGGEDTARMWKNLMFDTAELIAAEGWRKKMQDLIELTSIKVSVSEGVARAAQREAAEIANGDPVVFNQEMQRLVREALRADSFEFDLGDFEILNPISPKAKTPSGKTFVGMVDEDTLAGLMLRQVNDRTIDPDAPGDFYLMPRAVYKGIQDSLADESFRFRPSTRGGVRGAITGYNLDRVTRAWRTLTLNVLPKTAFANMTGSAILALQAGAGPRSWYYAWRALTGRKDKNGREMPVPKELLQRYYDQFTPEVGTSGRLRDRPSAVQAGAAWVAWWMNNMRRLNGMSEDFGRLAVWYSKAYPEALKFANNEGSTVFSRAKKLNDDAMDMLDSMARGDADWASRNDAWLRQSYDFLGYLHKGGQTAARLRIAIPFWQWYMHMLKLTFVTMPVKYPGRALLLQQLGEIGEEYQKTHGVMIPGYEDLIPLHTFETSVMGMPQFVTTAVGSSAWYPQGTVASLGGNEGNPNILGYVRGSINPMITNGFLIGLTLGMPFGSPALEYSDFQGLKAAKNEYGNEITGFGDWANFVANKAGQMMPLAPMVMSLASRPANSTLWNLQERAVDGPRIPTRRTDFVTLVDDPWGPNALAYLLKAFTGMQFQDVPGIGPVEQARIRKIADAEARNASREEANMARVLLERLIAEDTTSGGVVPVPGGGEQ